MGVVRIARVEIAQQPWGLVIDDVGDTYKKKAAATVQIKNLDGSNATHWSAITGGSSSTGTITTNADGTIPRYIDPGSYELFVNSVSEGRVEAVAASMGGVTNVQHAPYRATGDGSTNDTTALQAAIDAVSAAGGGTVLFPLGVYKHTGLTISAGSKVKLDLRSGPELNHSASTAGTTAITVTGSVNTKVNLSASTAAGDNTVKVTNDAAITAAGIVAGDWVRVSDSKDYAPTRVAGSKQGELAQVMAVPPATALTAQLLAAATTATVSTTAGYPTTGTIVVEAEQMTYTNKTANTFTGLGRGANGTTDATHASTTAVNPITGGYIYLRSPLAGGPYTTADTATVQKLNMLEGVEVWGGTIKGGGVGLNHAGIVFTQTVGSKVYGTKVIDCAQLGVSLKDSEGFLVDGIHAENMASALGYGVTIGDASQDGRVVNSYFKNCRHAFTGGGGLTNFGLPRRITFANNNVWDSGFNDPGGAGVAQGDALDCHANMEDISFLNNTVYDGAGMGLNIECARVTVIGNTIHRVVSHGINWLNGTPYPGHAIITGNKVLNAGGIGINVINQITDGVANKAVVVANNVVTNPGTTAIAVVGLSALHHVNVAVTGNVLSDTVANGLYLQYVDGASVTGNHSRGGYGFRLDTLTKTTVTGNLAECTGQVAFNLLGTCTGCVVMGNTAVACATGASLANTCTDNTISSNDLKGATTNALVPGTGAGNVFDGNQPKLPTQVVATNASFTLTPNTSPEHTLHTGTLTIDRTITLSTSQAWEGLTWRVTRTGAGAFNLSVGGLKNLVQNTYAEVKYIAGAYVLTGYGAL